MQDLDKTFESAEYLASWAVQGAKRFTSCRDAYFSDPNTSERVEEFDPESGHMVQKIRLKRPLPMEMRGIASDVVKNFRDALDQTTFAATLLIRDKKSNRAHFPFGENPDDLENSLSRRRAVPCSGLADALFPVLRACEPYPKGDGYSGGNDLLRALGRISGDNKHAVTLTVFGSALYTSFKPPGFEVGPGGAHMINNGWKAEQNELWIVSYPPGGYFKGDYDVSMSVIFGPGPLEGWIVEDVFEQLASSVLGIIAKVKQATSVIIS